MCTKNRVVYTCEQPACAKNQVVYTYGSSFKDSALPDPKITFKKPFKINVF